MAAWKGASWWFYPQPHPNEIKLSLLERGGQVELRVGAAVAFKSMGESVESLAHREHQANIY